MNGEKISGLVKKITAPVMVAGAIALAGCTQSPAVPSAVSDKPRTTQPEVVDERPYEGCENPEDLANWDDLKNDPTYTHVVPPECEDYVNSSRMQGGYGN